MWCFSSKLVHESFVFPTSLSADISSLPFFKNIFRKKVRLLFQGLFEISLCKVKRILNFLLTSTLKFEVYGDQNRIFSFTCTVLYVKHLYQYIIFFVKLLIYDAAAWISGHWREKCLLSVLQMCFCFAFKMGTDLF